MNELPWHPLHKLYMDDKIVDVVSFYFRQAFNADLVINKVAGAIIPLHVGCRPTMEEREDRASASYMNKLCELPLLEQQGDGMRSFVSVLLDTFTSEHTITLIDEPEAFLHPPQARLLGKMLATHNPDGRQLFISTHSEDFLQGLLDADNDNVTVIRINRNENINHMSILQSSDIKALWDKPLLRYSNILSGLFHEKVVVCESDYDCLFYRSVIDAIYEDKGEFAPDIMFTHCGGKDRIHTAVSALHALNVTVVALTDFDILNVGAKFKKLVTAFGVDWDTTLAEQMKTIYQNMGGTAKSWEAIKKIGKQGFEGNAPAAYEAVEQVCRKAGLFVIPLGEIECFDKTVTEKKEGMGVLRFGKL